MLRSLHDLEQYAIQATDGVVGRVKDFYFDDDRWVVRYLIVETGSWLSSRQVLIPPNAIGAPNWAERTLPVALTREQIRGAPNIDTAKPVSRQHEMDYLGYYSFPYYWKGDNLLGEGAYHDRVLADSGASDRASHLRSARALKAYQIDASDGPIGHVQSMLVDEQSWEVRFLIADTSNWWLGHEVLISPRWIRELHWLSATVSIGLTRQALQDAPPYVPFVPHDRQAADPGLYSHDGHKSWADAVKLENPEFHPVSAAAATRTQHHREPRP